MSNPVPARCGTTLWGGGALICGLCLFPWCTFSQHHWVH